MRKMRTPLVIGAAAVGLVAQSAPASAQEAGALDTATVQLNLDVLFFMVAICLVFLMQAGFALLETGLTASKNSANIMMKNMADFLFGLLAYFAVGFGIMYGANNGFFGTDTFFLSAGSYTEGLTAEPFLGVDFLYQAVFAATAATIVSGAVAGRMKFSGYIIMSIAMTALIYPVVGAWHWGGGWLSSLGFHDFAGSTIVHLTGGTAALVGAAILGPRIGKFAKDGKPQVIPGHSAPLASLGTLVLFFGWFGFNGGSVLAADGTAIPPVLLVTALAGAAGGMTSLCFTWVRFRKPDLSMTCNGILAGLVGITAGADQVGPVAAIGVGMVAGVLVVLSVAAVDRLGIDDAVGAFSVHGAGGILGTWWVGVFANTADRTGLWHGGGFGLLGTQVLGTVAVIAFVAALTGLLFLALRATGLLRVSEEVEIDGLDIHEHGMYGYPETALGAAVYPRGPATTPTDAARAAPAPAVHGPVLQD